MPDMNGIKALKTWPEEDKESEDILKTTAIILNTTAPKEAEKMKILKQLIFYKL